MSQTMCPDADIDLFVHGLSAEAAQAKMLSLFTRLRRTILRAVGVENDVYFIKTPNTVTIGCAQPALTAPLSCPAPRGAPSPCSARPHWKAASATATCRSSRGCTAAWSTSSTASTSTAAASGGTAPPCVPRRVLRLQSAPRSTPSTCRSGASATSRGCSSTSSAATPSACSTSSAPRWTASTSLSNRRSAGATSPSLPATVGESGARRMD